MQRITSKKSRLFGIATSFLMVAAMIGNIGDGLLKAETISAATATPVGYGEGTTGGAGGTEVTVSTGTAFLAALDSKGSSPLTIYVDGTITLDNSGADELLMKDLSDISVIGVGTNGECNGIGIRMVRCENIIIQNMEIHHVLKGAGEGDSVSIEGSWNVWVDHCEFYNEYDGNESNKDVYDGLLDSKKDSGNLTYSYNYFHDSWKTMLCGFSDSDNYDRTYTIHHNIFENCNSRLPLFRFGHAHIYNNYYKDIYTSGINTRMGAEVYVENNIFSAVNNAVCSLDSNAIGYWNLSGNTFTDCYAGTVVSSTAEQSWTEGAANTCTYKPTYSYTAESTTTLLATLNSTVGIGKVGAVSGETTGTTAGETTTTTTAAGTTTAPISGSAMTHNFTTDGVTSSYFTIAGSASEKTTNTYAGLTLTDALKMDSTGSISFTTTEAATVTLVYNSKAAGAELNLDGDTAISGIGTDVTVSTLNLSAGTHTLSKGSGEVYIYYIAVSGGTGGTISTTTTTTPAGGTTTTTTKTTTSANPVSDAIYCAPNGSASASGSMSDPMTVEAALTAVNAGGTIYCLAGTYSFSSTVKVDESNSGSAGAYKTISAYPGADVIFDFSAMETASSNRGVSMEGHYWHWYGIMMQYAGDNGMILAGSNNIIEMCEFFNNQDTGLQLSRANTSYSDISQWPSNNLILNCTSSNNCDDATMENADGFAAKLTCGEGNVFDGCMAYNNSDDGWDLYAKTETGPIGVVTIQNCIAFRNGYTEDGRGYGDCDGNGFKLGGSGVGSAHVVKNCIAFENLHHGFTDNNNPDLGSLTDCTSYANAIGGSKANFQLDRCTAGVFTNLLSYIGGSSCGSDKFVGTISNSVYYNSSKYYQVDGATAIKSDKVGTNVTGPTDADFVSVTAPSMGSDFHSLWRNADGSINTQGFLMLKSTSEFGEMGATFTESDVIVTTTTTTGTTTTTTTTTTSDTTTTTTTTTSGVVSGALYGDVNDDKNITVSDIILLARYVAEDTTVSITEIGLINAECDADGSIGAGDITQISRYLSHQITVIR